MGRSRARAAHRMKHLLTLSLALLLSACRTEDATQDTADEAPAAAASVPSTSTEQAPSVDPIEALRAHEAELMTRAEKDLPEVRVQHILIAFAGATRSRATRTQEEAEALAADLYQQLLAGADMGELVRAYSDDPGAGVYTMTTGRPGFGIYARQQMVPAFGDVGWRLDVGEVGVAPYDPKNSPFGWHIIKRLK